MKVTHITLQSKNPKRVNVSIDGRYRFSLDIQQVIELGLKVGKDYSEQDINDYEHASQLGKLYTQALEYVMLRPHSAYEMRQYLWRKTLPTKYISKKTGQLCERTGVDQSMADAVYDKLLQKGYIDDVTFARWWVTHRHIRKGVSRRKLRNELSIAGVPQDIIDDVIQHSSREETDELQKIIARKRYKYHTTHQLIAYLARQGFAYDDIQDALRDDM